MMPTPEPLSTSIRAMLDLESLIPAVSPAVRARVMAQARAALITREEPLLVAELAPMASRSAPHTRWAAAAALVAVTGLAAGAGAYAFRARHESPRARASAVPAPTALAEVRSKGRATAVARPAEKAVLVPEGGAAPARLLPADAVRAELRLLRRARTAVIREDFAAALAPIAEHARRFQDGRLAEEREALRVKTLAGLGRTAEAERAATEFKTRFPRSVLSPAVSKMPSSRP